jgi:hydrogenase/urease accessory protein HupE
MQNLQRTRRLPGPLLLITLAWLVLTGTMLRAHDPGLSSLDVNVSGGSVSASLSIAASDVALMAPTGGTRPNLGQFAHDAVRLYIDDYVVPSVIADISIENGAARVQLSFALARLRDRARRLAIASDVPKRIARGHRELMVVRVDDRVVTETLLDSNTGPVTFTLEAVSPSATRAAGRFLELGVRHILAGYDHLVFLAGLLLAARAVRELVVALTAFTAAHSVSLALTVIGGVHAPVWIVEPLIAASIAWVGLENLLQRRSCASRVVVFGFGLIHGFGFAGALMELGFGSSAAEMALALISFNFGVEAGQLAAAVVMLPLVWTLRSLALWQARLLPACSGLIVIAGGYWLIERLH